MALVIGAFIIQGITPGPDVITEQPALVWGLIAFFGILGYVVIKCGCEPAPLLLGFVLGPLLEENLRRALIISRGDPTVFVTRPISAALMVVAVGALVLAVLPAIRRRREVVFQEEL
jgi:putative tricarboxylic transport membrane protein